MGPLKLQSHLKGASPEAKPEYQNIVMTFILNIDNKKKN